MKKNNLSKILLLSLMTVASLASCDTTGTTVSSGAIVNSILVDSVETAVVGDKINLKDHVTIDGNVTEFETELLTTNTATLNGYELVITAEGQVTVLVSAGGKERAFSLKAISKLQDEYRKYTEDIEYNFFIGQIVSSGSIDRLSPNGYIFNENYSAFDMSIFGDSGYMGEIYNGNEVYSFTMDDYLGNNIKVDPGVFSPLYYGKTGFALTYDLFDNLQETTGYSLVAGPDVVNAFTYSYLKFTLNDDYYKQIVESEGLKYEGLRLRVKMDSELSADELTVISYPKFYIEFGFSNTTQTAYQTIESFYLRKEASFYTVDKIEEMLNNGMTARKVTPQKLFDSVDKIANAKNYTLDIKGYWSTSKGEPSSMPTDLDPNYIWFELIPALMIENHQISYVTEKEALLENLIGEKTAYNHYTEENGKVYNVTNYEIDAEKNFVIGTPSEKTEVANKTTLWDGKTSLIDGLANSTNKATMNVVYEKTEEATDPEENYDYIFSSVGQGYKYINDIFALNPFYGNTWSAILSMTRNDSETGYEFSFAELMMIQMVSFVAEDSLKLSLTFGWDSDHYYHLDYVFSNIGTTVIPTV